MIRRNHNVVNCEGHYLRKRTLVYISEIDVRIQLQVTPIGGMGAAHFRPRVGVCGCGRSRG